MLNEMPRRTIGIPTKASEKSALGGKNKNKDLENIKKLIDSAENNLKAARTQIADILGEDVNIKNDSQDISLSGSGKIIEGRFNGEGMVDDNDKLYPIPANYASKSKLVEGDRLKLTISSDGSFIFKQIGPVERKKLIGSLKKENDQYIVEAEKSIFKVLTASVTYFKGKDGDEVTIIVPEGKKSQWAAVEAVISK